MSAEEEKPGSSPGTLRAGSAGSSRHSSNASSRPKPRQPRWALGILNDRETDEVPGKSSRGTFPSSPLLIAQKAPYFCYPMFRTVTRRLVCSMLQGGHQLPHSHLRSRLGLLATTLTHRMALRTRPKKLRTAKQSWNPSLMSPKMTRSIGQHCVEMLLYCHLVCTVW